MAPLPDKPNFYGSLHTALPKRRIAELFRPLATGFRACAWDELEIFFPWAELILASESPVLMHGSVTDVLANAEHLLEVLRAAGVGYSVECYDEGGELLRETDFKP